MEHSNAYINFTSNFTVVSVIENKIIPVEYDMELRVLNTSMDPEIVDVAYKRLDILFEILNYSVFIDANAEFDQLMHLTYNNVIEFYEIPHDYTVIKTLFFKANAILEGNLIVENITSVSSIVPNMEISYSGFLNDEKTELDDIETDVNWRKELKIVGLDLPWWHRNDTSTTNIIVEDEDDNPILNDNNLTWEDHFLEWEQDEPTHTVADIINFNKPFTPEIVPGGKNED